jgi:CRISPR/Cas system-associated exonuclease Cas4 (RecB family)
MTLVKDNEHVTINRGFGTKEFGARLEEAMKREDSERTKTSFAPSGLGYSGSCPRYWYYAFHGANFSYDTDALAMANMDAGSDAGKRLADVLKKADLLVAEEVPVRWQDPPIFGFIDALVNWKDEVVVAEIKTTKQETWQMRANSNSVPGYQMLQLLIYMYITNKPRGFFLTENKNTNEIFILPVRMTEEFYKWVEEVFEWMRAVKKNSDDDLLPTRPFTKASLQCKGCAVKDTCWAGWTRTNKSKGTGADPSPGVVTLPVLNIPK